MVVGKPTDLNTKALQEIKDLEFYIWYTGVPHALVRDLYNIGI
jgi:hypothetical protein